MTSAFLPYAEQSSAPTRRRGVSRWSLCRARGASPRAPSSAPRDARRRGRGRRAPPASFSASRSWTKTPSRRRRRDEARRVTLFANEQPRFVPRFRENARGGRRDVRAAERRDAFSFLPFRDENASIRRPEKTRLDVFEVVAAVRAFAFRVRSKARSRLLARAFRQHVAPPPLAGPRAPGPTRPDIDIFARRGLATTARVAGAGTPGVRQPRESASDPSTSAQSRWPSPSRSRPSQNLFLSGRSNFFGSRATSYGASSSVHARGVFESSSKAPPSPCARRAWRRAPREDAT